MSEIKLPTDPQQLAELVGRALHERDQALRGLGVRVLEIRPGYARLEMTVRADMANSHGTCQGGFIFTLADGAFAYACNSYNQTAVAASCTIDFLLPAHTGDVLRAEAEERCLLGRTGVYDVCVTNQEERSVALFRGRSHRTKTPVVAG